jgi:hypothetical protein
MKPTRISTSQGHVLCILNLKSCKETWTTRAASNDNEGRIPTSRCLSLFHALFLLSNNGNGNGNGNEDKEKQ